VKAITFTLHAPDACAKKERSPSRNIDIVRRSMPVIAS